LVLSEETAIQNDPEAQQEAILQAALECFDQFGYERTILEDIAARAGLPLAVVLEHFPAKTDVMTGLHSLWAERLSAWIVYA
jgi:AcrR family transcriptional regulator